MKLRLKYDYDEQLLINKINKGLIIGFYEHDDSLPKFYEGFEPLTVAFEILT